MRIYHDDLAVLNLTEGNGLLRALVMTGIPIATAAAALIATNTARIVLVVVAVAFLPWVVPSWWFWLRRHEAETQRIQAEARAANDVRVVAVKLEIELRHADLSLVQAIHNLSAEQVALAKDMSAAPTVDLIPGTGFRWILDGITVPVWFAAEWNRVYLSLTGDELPGQGTWNSTPGRDNYRLYNAALTNELIKRGWVRQADSHFPPRWIIPDGGARENALHYIRLGLALLAAGWNDETETEASE